jgi:hypothetical protein
MEIPLSDRRILKSLSSLLFHGIDVVAFQLLENVLSGQLRQQRSEYADSHGDAPLCMGAEPTTEYHAVLSEYLGSWRKSRVASPQRRKDAEENAEKHILAFSALISASLGLCGE